MSHPRFDWWPYVKGMICRYPEMKKPLSGTRLREYEAVEKAIEQTKRYADGQERLTVIDAVFWKRSCTVSEVEHPFTRQYHKEFIQLVAAYFGLLD